jgi:two-component system nitrate/nitrite response regulator NarL
MKILIVDDHAMVRQALAALLERSAPGIEVVQAGDVAQALDLARRHADLDAVFLDLGLPGPGGMDALVELGRLRPALPVIVLTAAEDPDLARQAFAAGALGYVPKSATPETLLSALQLVMRGETYVPALVLRPAAPRDPAAWKLTGQQAEVLRLMGEGLSNKAIARRMGLSEKTVKAHVTGVFRALSVTGRREAAAVAQAAGFS